MSDLTEAKLPGQTGGDRQNLADGRILRVRRPQPLDDGSLVSAEIVEEREDEVFDEVMDVSARTEKRPSNFEAADPVALERKNFDVLDGGYGWMVVFGCFLMHVINVGLIKSFGIVFVALREDYVGSSSTDVAWIYSLFLVCSTWFAPLASFLANAFTQRSVVMLGGLLLGLGISFSYFAQSLLFWYFSYGCLSGLGSAFSYTPAVVAVGTYFEKRRALANGLSLSGAAIGSITVPYLVTYLIDEYTVSGAILVSGAFAFNVCVAGALLRPIGTHIRILRAQEGRAAQMEARRLHNSNQDPTTVTMVKAFSAPASARSNGIGSFYGADEVNPHLLETPMQEDRKRSAHSMPDEALNSASRIEKTKNSERKIKTVSFGERFRGRFRRREGQPPLFDFTLFRVRLFIMYATAVMLSTFSYMNIFLILPAHSRDIGMDPAFGAKLIAIIGIADIFARIGFGWFSDLKLFHRKWGFCGAIYCASICNFVVPLATNEIGLGCYAACLGAASGSYISLVAVVCVDFFGLPRLSSALGSVIAFQGIAFLAGPPLIALIRDRTGSYAYGFLTLATCLVCAASLIVLEHFLSYFLDRRKRFQARKDLENNHEMAVSQTPNSVTSATGLVRPINFSPPIAHMDEFDPLTPRPVSKPVFKPKTRKHNG